MQFQPENTVHNFQHSQVMQEEYIFVSPLTYSLIVIAAVSKEFKNDYNRELAQQKLVNPFRIPTFAEKGLPYLISRSFLSDDDVKKMRWVSRFFLEFFPVREENSCEFDSEWYYNTYYYVGYEDSFDVNDDDDDDDSDSNGNDDNDDDDDDARLFDDGRNDRV